MASTAWRERVKGSRRLRGSATDTSSRPSSRAASAPPSAPSQPGWAVRQVVGAADGVANPEIAGGQDVVPAQGEDQEHVGGPHADALDLGQALDHLLVRKRRQFLEDQPLVARMTGQIADVGRFLCRKPQRAHPGRTELEDPFGGQRGPGGGRQPAEDHGCHAAAKLLKYNGFDEGLEIRVAELDGIVADPVDDCGQNRVRPAEVMDGFVHGETIVLRGTSPSLYRDANY